MPKNTARRPNGPESRPNRPALRRDNLPAFLRDWLRFVGPDTFEACAANATTLVNARHQPSSVQ